MKPKKYTIILISILLVFVSFPVMTSSDESVEDDVNIAATSSAGKYKTKDEVIYGKLDSNGSVKNMYVVNSFHISEPGKITDYGKYTNIRNLTDLSNINQTDEEIHFKANEEEFYYQAELENQPLPWDISITYVLNGQEMNPEKLPGQSGDLEITIETSVNKKVDPLFFENYLLQISLKLDPLVFRDIHAPKGTEANEGKNKLITFSIMPEQEEVLILSTHVNHLKMEPIEISAIPANIAMEDPDLDQMTEEMKALSDAIQKLDTGVSELNDGLSKLDDGTTELRKGSLEYKEGINTLDQSSAELVQGSQQIANILQQVNEGLKNSPDLPEFDLEDIKALPQGLRELAKRLNELAANIEELDTTINQIPDGTITEQQLNQLEEVIKNSGGNEQVLDQLVKTYYAAQKAKELSDKTPSNLATLIKEMGKYAEKIADEIDNNLETIEKFDGLDDLQTGLATLSSEYITFHQGLISYTKGVHTLTTSYEELDDGIQDISDGVSFIHLGTSDLRKGTKELSEATHNLPNDIQSEVDKLLEEYDFSDFKPISFVSRLNENIGVVQFVLRTETIDIEEPKESTEHVEEKKGIWERFLDLFR